MHRRHFNGPGPGYRSNSMGMGGMANASRISPEGSMRGHRRFNSEPNNYNHGGNRRGGQSKQFQPPLPPARGTDIFMEAGRLAAEYLVSKGVLPPNALSGKWQNNGLKNQVGVFRGLRPPQVENGPSIIDGRASTHLRPGNAALDADPNRRRYFDDYNYTGTRSPVKVIRNIEPSKIYGSEDKRELEKGGSPTERSGSAPGMDANNDASAGNHDVQPVCKEDNGGLENLSPGETAQVGTTAHVESESDKCDSVEDELTEAKSLSNEKCVPSDVSMEPAKEPDDTNRSSVETGGLEEGRNENDVEQKNDEKEEVTPSEKDYSSLSNKGLNSNEDHMNEDENVSNRELNDVSISHGMDVPVETLNDKSSSDHNHDLVKLETEETSVFGCTNSDFIDKGGKRALGDDNDGRESSKKLREWVPTMDAQIDASPPLSGSMNNLPPPQEPRTSKSSYTALSDEQKNVDMSVFPKGGTSLSEFMEEKQLFPGSYKTCDLNLIGTGDVNDHNDVSNRVSFPSVGGPGTEAAPIDVDLSMGNKSSLLNKNGKHGVSNTDIEVIDLENEAAQGGNGFNNPERRGDIVFSDLDGFHNNAHNANEIPDAQDGYGIMISELLGSDIPNSSSVPTDLNNLQNNIDFSNREGILGDDDSIYMSLGEIPISLLGPWEQPTPDYGKPF